MSSAASLKPFDPSVVQTVITPDLYLLDRNPGMTIQSQNGEQQGRIGHIKTQEGLVKTSQPITFSIAELKPGRT